MKLIRRTVLIACLALTPHLLGQGTIGLSQQDLEAAQFFYFSWTLSMSPGETLDGARVAFPDGARGDIIREIYRNTSERGDYTPDLAYDSLMMARNEYCRASLVVLGRFTGVEQVVLSPNRQAIYTAGQFKIERMLEGGEQNRVGDLITYLYIGGTYHEPDGTVLRTQLAGKPLHPFARNELYLLRLEKNRPDQGYPSEVYFSSDTFQVKVVNGHLYSSKRISDQAIPNPVHDGESFTAYWTHVADFIAKHPCPKEP